MKNIEITEHALERAKERFSWNEKTVNRLAKKAFELGFKHSQFNGIVKRYLNNLYLNNPNCNNIRIYGEMVYFFNKKRLVTLFKAPKIIVKQIERCLIVIEE